LILSTSVVIKDTPSLSLLFTNFRERLNLQAGSPHGFKMVVSECRTTWILPYSHPIGKSER
jgi:hypothetical protein